MLPATLLCTALLWRRAVTAIAVPPDVPSGAVTFDPSLLSVSIEFFTLPGYTQIQATHNCLENLAVLRGAPPAIRIGGTTQYVCLACSAVHGWAFQPDSADLDFFPITLSI